MTGVVAGLRSQTAIYNTTVVESERATGLLGKKLDIVASTDADKMERAIKGIGTSFSEAFGDKVVKAIASMSDFAGGAENLQGIGTATASAVQAIATATTLLGSHSLLTNKRVGLLLGNLRKLVNTPVGAAGLLLSLAPIAADTGKAIGGKITKLIQSSATEQVTAAGKSFDAFKQAEDKKFQLSKRNTEEITKLALQSAAELGAAYNASGESIKKSFTNPTPAINAFIEQNKKALEAAAEQRKALALAQKESESFQVHPADARATVTRCG